MSQKLIQLFSLLSELERTVLARRQVLTDYSDYNPYQIFSFLDKEKKGNINDYNIIDYLNSKGYDVNQEEAQFLIMFYDKNFDNVLSFNEFIKLIQNDNRSFVPDLNDDKEIILNFNIDYCLEKILVKEIEMVKILIRFKNSLNCDINDLFFICDSANKNYIMFNDIKKFLENNNIKFYDNDIIGIIKRMDLNGDGKIDINEFHYFFEFPKNKLNYNRRNSKYLKKNNLYNDYCNKKINKYNKKYKENNLNNNKKKYNKCDYSLFVNNDILNNSKNYKKNISKEKNYESIKCDNEKYCCPCKYQYTPGCPECYKEHLLEMNNENKRNNDINDSIYNNKNSEFGEKISNNLNLRRSPVRRFPPKKRFSQSYVKSNYKPKIKQKKTLKLISNNSQNFEDYQISEIQSDKKIKHLPKNINNDLTTNIKNINDNIYNNDNYNNNNYNNDNYNNDNNKNNVNNENNNNYNNNYNNDNYNNVNNYNVNISSKPIEKIKNKIPRQTYSNPMNLNENYYFDYGSNNNNSIENSKNKNHHRSISSTSQYLNKSINTNNISKDSIFVNNINTSYISNNIKTNNINISNIKTNDNNTNKFNTNDNTKKFNTNKFNINKINKNNTNINTNININITSEKKKNIVDYMKILINGESQIELTKINLILRPDFNCIDVFNLLKNNSNNNYITFDDLKQSLASLNISTNELDIKLLMKRFNNNTIDLNSFIEAIIPYQENYRKIANKNSNNYSCNNKKGDFFTPTTLLYLKILINMMIDLEKKLNEFKIKNNSNELSESLSNILKQFDSDGKGFLSQNEFNCFLKENQIYLTMNSAALLFKRLDRKKIGKLIYNDFCDEFYCIK